jgi:hypothetical protein
MGGAQEGGGGENLPVFAWWPGFVIRYPRGATSGFGVMALGQTAPAGLVQGVKNSWAKLNFLRYQCISVVISKRPLFESALVSLPLAFRGTESFAWPSSEFPEHFRHLPPSGEAKEAT